MNRERRYITISIAAFICYCNTLWGSFVFDDSEAIVKNKDVMPHTPVGEIFKNDFWGADISLNSSHKSYRPLTILSYRLNVVYSNNKLDAFQFHATNIILYGLLCILTIPVFHLFVKKKKLKKYLLNQVDDVAYFAGLLFTVHPVHTESVAALVGRADILSSILFLVALLVYNQAINNQSISLFCCVILCTAGAVLCKETAITVLVFSYSYIYFLNLVLLIWPQWLCFDWSMGCVPLIEHITDVRLIFVLLFWLCIFSTIFIVIKRVLFTSIFDGYMMGIALMILPFIPASNLIFKVGFVIAERTLLLPSAGFCFLIGTGIKKIENYFEKNKGVVHIIFYIIVIIFATRCIQRNMEWLTEEKLFSSALKVCPLNAKVHYNVAKIAADKSDKELALMEYRKALQLNPNYEQAMNNLANLLREDKKFHEAEVLLRRALEVRPNFAAAWMNLGIVLTNLNQTEEAEQCYKTAILHRNKYPDCYYNLGNLYLDLKRNDEALRAWEKAVFHRPTHVAAWSNTLVLLDSMRKYDEVLELGKAALLHNPKSPALYFSIANTLGKLQKFDKAEKHFLEAIRLSPKNALYYSNLGVLYHRWNKLDKAREMYEKALRIDPNMKTTETNLKKLNVQ